MRVGRHRQRPPEERRQVAQHLQRTLPQPLRVDQVARRLLPDHDARLGEGGGEVPGAAAVVEVDVGQQDPVQARHAAAAQLRRQACGIVLAGPGSTT